MLVITSLGKPKPLSLVKLIYGTFYNRQSQINFQDQKKPLSSDSHLKLYTVIDKPGLPSVCRGGGCSGVMLEVCR